MECAKCAAKIEEPLVLKRGDFRNRPLCNDCFKIERKKIMPELEENGN